MGVFTNYQDSSVLSLGLHDLSQEGLGWMVGSKPLRILHLIFSCITESVSFLAKRIGGIFLLFLVDGLG